MQKVHNPVSAKEDREKLAYLYQKFQAATPSRKFAGIADVRTEFAIVATSA